MTELWPITIGSIILAFLADKTEYYTLRKRCKLSTIITVLLAAIMILFVGLRVHYNDTDTYIHSYVNTTETSLRDVSWELGSNPGYNIVRILFFNLGMSSQTYLLAYAAATVGIHVWFLKKYSTNFFLSIILFIMTGAFTSCLAAMKQCMAIAFCLIATDRIISRRYIRAFIWIGVASLFHPYALMYLIVPFMRFRPWSRKTVMMIGIFAACGILLESLLGTVVSVTSMIGEEYTVEAFSGDGVNPFRLIVCAVPIAISWLTRKIIKIENNSIQNLMLNLAMVNAEIMFVALFGTANYFARLANYFIVFQSLALPWLFTHFEHKSRRAMEICAVLCYTAYFYYANKINQPFDSLYFAISFAQYLKSFF